MVIVQSVLAPIGVGVALVVGLSLIPSRHRRSFGAVCDAVIALWYFADAPSVPEVLRGRRRDEQLGPVGDA